MIKRIIVLLSLLLFLFSCSQKSSLEGEEYGRSVIQCNIEASISSTKTALLSDSTTVVWRSGDRISVLSATGDNVPFYIVTGIGTSSASFAGDLEGQAPYTAFYPSSNEVSVQDNVLFFHLPDSQTYYADTFGPGYSPMVASVADLSTPVAFKNLCGILCIRLTAKPTFSVSRLVVKDLAGNMLWGDCHLSLDGKEGTEAQTMTLTGGSDELTVVMTPSVMLPESKSLRFYIVVPPGALSDGFTVTVYDEAGETPAVLKTLNPAARVERSRITNMARYDIRTEPADPSKRGYYKDIFMDSGIYLNSFRTIAAFSYIGWDFEYFCTPSYTSYTNNDITLQKTYFESAKDDENGYILYPDRQPRFRCIFLNGGSSFTHGKSLGETGRQTIYDFVYNGGSYLGTCAGAFLATKYRDGTKGPYPDYIGVFPGRMFSSGIDDDTRTDLTMRADCPLQKYFTFDETITGIRHHGGGYMSEKAEELPEGTEILFRFANCPPGHESINGRVNGWAYKPSEKTGRMVLTGSHPEKETEGNRRDLFGAMLLYAADGLGNPPIKASLSKGLTYDCTALSSANTPSHARIGDKQYHHFTVEIPDGATNIKFSLESEWAEEDLYLSLRKKGYAWFSEADYTLTFNGSNKVLSVPSLEPGKWYVSVYAPSTIIATETTYSSTGGYYKYTGKTHLLNGIPYTITVDWFTDKRNGGNENFKGQDNLGDDFEFEFD